MSEVVENSVSATPEAAPAATTPTNLFAGVQDTAPAAIPTSGAPTRPEYVPEKFWNPEKGEVRLEEFAKSYTNLESLRGGAKDVLRIPGENANPEEIKEFRSKLGVPDDAAKYDIKLPEGTQVDASMLDWFKGVAHKANIPNEAANALVNDYVATQVASWNEQANKTEAELMKEWGNKYQDNMKGAYQTLVHFAGGKEAADRIANVLGNDAGFIRALTNIRSQMSEDTIGDATTPSFNTVNVEKRLNEILRDKTSKDFVALYNNNDPRHSEVMSEVRRLQEELHKARGNFAA